MARTVTGGRARWWRWRTRRVWLTGAVTALALLVGGLAVLAWPVDRSAADGRPSSRASGGAAGPADPATAPAPEASASPPSGQGAVPQQPLGVPLGGPQRQLVRTAQLTVDVADSAAAIRQVRTTATVAGGLVVEEQVSDGGGWVVIRVPADGLDRVIDDIGAIGRVTARSSQIVDSTAEVVDFEARVASQQASVARVRALLVQATSIGDVVAIESELARREADLDSLTNRLAALRDQVAMSTLSVELHTPSTAVLDDDPRAAGFSDGLDAGWRGLVALGTAVAAVAGFLLPFLPVLAVLLGVGWLTRRLVRGRRAPAPAGPGSSGQS